MATRDELELVAVMARIGRDDRDLFRQLRDEAWAMVQTNHEKQSPVQRKKWMRNAS